MKFDRAKFLPWNSNYLEIDRQQNSSRQNHRWQSFHWKMHYFDVGQDDASGERTVILLHGNPTWSFFFRELIRDLSPEFRVIVPDYLGCGLSDKTPGVSFGATDRVDHLERLIAALKLQSFHLVMHDWGGPIGTALAGRNPDRVRSLTFFNTTLTETENLPGFIKIAATPLIGKFLTQHTKSFLRLMLRFGVSKKLPREVCNGYLFPYRGAIDREAIWNFVADIPFDEWHPRFSTLHDVASQIPALADIPVLIVWGLRDPCFHREMLNQVAGHFPQAKVVEIPEASHLVLEDAPELACSTVKRFLRESAEAGGRKAARASGMGGEALVPPGAPALYSELLQLAAATPDREAVIVPSRESVSFALGVEGPGMSLETVTFNGLLKLVRKYERGFSENGLKPGDKALMLVPPGIEFLALSYALLARGAIPIFLDPGMGKENLLRCIHDADPNVFIGSAKAHLLRALRPRLFSKLKFSVMAHQISFGLEGLGLRRLGRSLNLGFLKRFSSTPLQTLEVSPNDMALVAYTSGATGTPKGVVFTHEMLRQQVRIFREVFGLNPQARDMPLLPIFSLFGLACGVTTIFAPINPAQPLNFRPEELVRTISQLRVSTSFGSPTLWRKLLEYCKRRQVTLPSLKSVFMAGAPVPRGVLELLAAIAGNAKSYTPYGATEALPVTLGDGSELLEIELSEAKDGGCGTPVGRVVNGVQLKIIAPIDQSDAANVQVRELGANEIGEIIVSGGNVSPAYLNRPDANNAAKIRHADRLWHRMGDMGYFDQSGILYFCGRKSHMVVCPKGVFYSEPVERVFNQHPKLRRSALIAVRADDQVAVAVEPFPEHFPRSASSRAVFAEELRVMAKAHKVTEKIEKFFFHPSFPVDARHNAKIFRDRLGEWASLSEIKLKRVA